MEKIYKVRKYRHIGIETFCLAHSLKYIRVDEISDSYYYSITASDVIHKKLRKHFKTGVTMVASRGKKC